MLSCGYLTRLDAGFDRFQIDEAQRRLVDERLRVFVVRQMLARQHEISSFPVLYHGAYLQNRKLRVHNNDAARATQTAFDGRQTDAGRTNLV